MAVQPIQFTSPEEKAAFWRYVWQEGGKLDINSWRANRAPKTPVNQAAIAAAQKQIDPFLTTEQQATRAEEMREAQRRVAAAQKMVEDSRLAAERNLAASSLQRTKDDDSIRNNAAARGLAQSSIRAGGLQENERITKEREDNVRKSDADLRAEQEAIVNQAREMYGQSLTGGGKRDIEYFNPLMVENAANTPRPDVPDPVYQAPIAEPARGWWEPPEPVVQKITTQQRQPTPRVSKKKRQR